MISRKTKKSSEKTMLNLLKRNKFHILIWAAMVVYLFAAKGLYVHLFLSAGKPIQYYQNIPPPTNRIKYSLGKLELDYIDNQNVYVLNGLAYLSEQTDQSQYERFLVLHSNKRSYLFPMIDLKNHSGFNTYLAKDYIQIGTYQVGFLFKHKTKDIVFYRGTKNKIIRTPNRLKIGRWKTSN
jgi:hypothetical protein